MTAVQLFCVYCNHDCHWRQDNDRVFYYSGKYAMTAVQLFCVHCIGAPAVFSFVKY